VRRGEGEYDLFMRVDSNTRGHTNWYYFSVSNGEFIGNVRFSLCNFRREKSLYQRVPSLLFQGLRPYVYSKLQDSEWHQGGRDVTYERKRPRYDFLYQ
jgi:cytosolic carboxypeptidase protein 2/3